MSKSASEQGQRAAQEQREFGDIAKDLREFVEQLIGGREATITGAELQSAIADVTRLYSSCSDAGGHGDVNFASTDMTTTDVVRFVCALMRSQDLNPFDLALWFSRINENSAAEVVA